MENRNQIGIKEFYRGKDIFITGATGFVGKVLLEKILRCCDVRRIYILIRPKRGKSVDERREEMFQSELFQGIKEEKVHVFSKVVFLCGDICEKNLGLTQLDINSIIENVSVVIHCAASISFFLSFRESIIANVSSTKEIADLCLNIHNLMAFVYVSTAFSNCDRREIDETVYPLPISIKGILNAIEWLGDDTLKSIEQEISNGRPNNYTLTKAMAENLLNETYMDLPLVIVRPSVVVAVWKDPIPGWLQGMGGANGVLTWYSKAILSSVVNDEEKRAEFIPVDSLANALLVAAWDKGTANSKELKVYNLTSTNFNPLSWNEVWYFFKQKLWCFPPKNPFLTYGLKTTTDEMSHQTRIILKDYIPAIFGDLFLLMQGKKMRMVKTCIGMNRLLRSLRLFLTTGWDFQAKNTLQLLDKIPPEEKEIFSFDFSNIHWKTFMENYALGIRRFILKEDLKIIPHARKSLLWKRFILEKFTVFLWSIVSYKIIGFILRHFWIIGKILISKLRQNIYNF